MNGAKVMGNRVRVMMVGENKNLKKDSIVLLSNLDPAISYDELKSMCEEFGKVLYIKHNPDVRDPFAYRATVCFQSTYEAKNCVKELHRTKLRGKPVNAILNDRNDKIIVVKGEIIPDMGIVKEALQVL